MRLHTGSQLLHIILPTSHMINAYASAITIARKQRKALQAANLELCLDVLQQMYGHDSARVARIWERLINAYRGSRSEREITYVLETASSFLATYYLAQAIEVRIDTMQGRRLGDMLELLAQGKALYLSDLTGSPEKTTPQADRFVTD